MSNNNDNQGVKERIKAQLLEATNDGDLKRIRQELKDQGEKPGSIDVCVSELRKKGHLKFGTTDTGDFYPVRIGKSELIPPEQALAHIRLQDGDYKLGFVDGMGVLIMAARYNQLLAASQAEVLSNQLKIMEESRKGSAEVAQEAAARAAASVGAQIMPEVEAIKTQIMSQGQNPMASMMMTLMMPSMQQAAQQLAKLFGATQPGATVQPGTGGGEQPPAFNPPNIEEHSINEWED